MLGTALGLPTLAGPVASSASPNWTGPFLGLQGGVAGAKITYTEEAIPNLTDEVVYRFSDQNAVYSIHAGYDQEVGDRYVWGVELSADWLDFDIDPLNSGGFGNLFSADYAVTASGRVGVLANPTTLVYGRAGLSAVSVSAEAGLNDRATALLPAAVFGAGVEAIIAGNLSARLEGTYTVPLQQLRIPADAEVFDPRFIKIMAGLTWRLDADESSERTIAELGDSSSFDGGYLGAVGGYNIGRMETPITTPGATIGPFASEGVDLGVMAGYDIRMDRFVAGLGAEFLATHAQFFDPGQNSPLQGSTTLFGSLDATAMLSGRVGLLTSDSTLVYGKAGLGLAQVTANPDFFTFGSGGTRWLVANQVGGGVETLVNEKMSMRLEGMLTTVTQGFVVDLTQTDQATLFPSAVTANAGLSWRF
jgi:outer membrane immunogenic protein